MRDIIKGCRLTLGMLLIVLTLGCTTTAFASSASVGFSTESTVITKGSTFTVTLTVDAEEVIGEFEGYIAYDAGVLEYVEGSDAISGSDGVLRISDTSISDTTKNKKYKLKFKGIKVGSSEIKLSDAPVIYDYESGQEMSVSTNRISVSVKSTKRVSTDTSLSSLKISPGKIIPEYAPDVQDYTASVDSDVSDIVISAITKDSKANVKVRGNEGLIQGMNDIVITVTAQSGDTKDYIIHVDKKAVNVSEETNSDNEKIDSFKVYTEDGRVYIENSYQYEIIPVPDGVEVPVGYSKTKLILYGINVEAYTVTNDLENDFLLIYVMNEEGAAGFYEYDRIEKTIQRYMGPSINETSQNEKEDVTSDEYKTKLTQLSIIIALLSALCAFLTIGIIRMYMKMKGYKMDDLD